MCIKRFVHILILEDDDTLRAVLATYLQTFSQMIVISAGSLREVQSIFTNHYKHPPSVAILDINLGANEPTGLDAYHWLRAQGFKGRIIFLTGHAHNHPVVQKAHQIQDAIIFEKPVDMEALESAVMECNDESKRKCA